MGGNKEFHLKVTLVNLIRSISVKILSSFYEITNLCALNPVTVGPSTTHIYK